MQIPPLEDESKLHAQPCNSSHTMATLPAATAWSAWSRPNSQHRTQLLDHIPAATARPGTQERTQLRDHIPAATAWPAWPHHVTLHRTQHHAQHYTQACHTAPCTAAGSHCCPQLRGAAQPGDMAQLHSQHTAACPGVRAAVGIGQTLSYVTIMTAA
eukprot:scaffold99039_cov31-Tisochrysis_lutea.AAC.1